MPDALLPQKAPHAECTQCPAREATFVPSEPAVGRVRLAIVGEGPGRTECEERRPFVGASGRMLAKGLRTLGLTRGDVHWTNAVLCDARPKDLARAAKCCRPRLAHELAAVASPVVVPVGAYGLQGALGMSKRPQITKWRGSVTPHVWHGERDAQGTTASTLDPDCRASRVSLVLPTVHPAFVMRAPKWAPVIEADFRRVGRVMRDGWRAPEDAPGRTLTVARTWEALTAALASLGPAVAGDVETVGLGPTETALVCFGLSDGVRTLVVPWARDLAGRESWWGVGVERVAAAVSDCLLSRTLVTHNGPAFDHIVWQRYGITWRAWDDTLLMSQALRSHMPKNLAHVVTSGDVDVPPWKTWDHGADMNVMWQYNGRDVLYTILRYHELREELAEAA